MKRKNLIQLNIICLIFFSFLFTNCSKENLEHVETNEIIDFPVAEFYSEEIEVFNESGEYSIIMDIVAKDEETYLRHIENWDYRITILYMDDTANNTNKTYDGKLDNIHNGENEKNINDVYTIINEVKIPENATGFDMIVTAKGTHLKSSWANSIWHHGPKYYHHAKAFWKPSAGVNNMIGVEWWTQYKWISDWRQKLFVELNSSNVEHQFYYPNYRIRAKIRHNWHNYGVQFKKWSEDNWGNDVNPTYP